MLQQAVSLQNIVLPQIQNLINESYRVYQEKIQGMVKGAALELHGSFGLRAEGNTGIFMAVLIH